MKEFLKQTAWLFIMLGCVIIQIIALLFGGISWMFRLIADALDDITHFALSKYRATKEQEDIPTEEVPT